MSGVGRRFVLCDVFTDRAFGGNPLAVLPAADGLDGAAMGRIAREFNLSETAFVARPDRPGDTARVRIFTPAVELPFAGHPNVGTAFVLARLGLVDGDTMRFAEAAGAVEVTVLRDAAGTATGASIDAPMPLVTAPAPDRTLLAEATGLAPDDLLDHPHAPVVASVGTAITVVAVTPDALARARPVSAAFDRLAGGDPPRRGRVPVDLSPRDDTGGRRHRGAPVRAGRGHSGRPCDRQCGGGARGAAAPVRPGPRPTDAHDRSGWPDRAAEHASGKRLACGRRGARAGRGRLRAGR